MKKILFAINNEDIINSIMKKYEEMFNEEIEHKNVYFFNALLTEIKKDKSYDTVVISEELEPFINTNYNEIDQFIFGKLDSVSDEVDQANIVLICSDRRKITDPILSKMFNIGVYSYLVGDDRSIDKVCKLIKNPRTKRDAKRYINYDPEANNSEATSDNEVSEIEIKNILAHYKKLGNNYKGYIDAFNSIAGQYNNTQLKIIISFLPPNVIAVLAKESEKYHEVINYFNIKNAQEEEIQEEAKPKKVKKNVAPGKKIKVKEKEVESPEPKKINITSKKVKEAKPQKETKVKPGKTTMQPNIIENTEKPIGEPIIIPGMKNNQKKIVYKMAKEMQKPEEIVKNIPPIEEEPVKKINIVTPNEDAPEPIFIPQPSSNGVRKVKAKKVVAEPVKAPKIEELEEIPEDIGDLNEFMFEPKEATNKEEKAIEEVQEMPEDMDGLEEFMLEPAEEQPYKEVVSEEPEDLGDLNEFMIEPEEEHPIEYVSQKAEEPVKVFEEVSEEPENNNVESQEEEVIYDKEQPIVILGQDKETPYNPVQNFVPNANYSKIVTFVGSPKSGSTFLINNVATQLASRGVRTAILDMTKKKDTYYIYTKNDANLRDIARISFFELTMGRDSGIIVSPYLTVFTGIPNENSQPYEYDSLMQVLKKEYEVILIDTDFGTSLEFFENAEEIYCVQDQDILTIQPLTEFLRELKSRGIALTKVNVAINKYVKSSLAPKLILGGLSYYNDPEMTYMDELISPQNVKYCIIPFDVVNYRKYLENLLDCNITLKGFTSEFVAAIKALAEMIYPASMQKK